MHDLTVSGSRISRAFGVVAAAALVCASVVAIAPPAGAAGCAGQATSWSGLGDGHSWSDGANWDSGVAPGPTDTADITASSPTVDSAGVTVCGLTIGAGVTLNTGTTGMTVVSSLDWSAAPNTTTTVSGSLDVQGSATLTSTAGAGTTGKLLFQSFDGTTPAVLTFAGAAGLDAGSDLVLNDALSNALVSGTLTLGAGSTVESATSSATDTNAQLNITGNVKLDGAVSSPQLDVNIGTTGAVDLTGYTWTLPGVAWSRWSSGAQVTSTGIPGSILVNGASHLLIDGTTTLGTGVTLAIDGGSTIADGTWFNTETGGVSGGTGTLTGAGTLDLRSGFMAGAVTLDTGFHTIATTGGSRMLTAAGFTPADALWTNLGTIAVRTGSFGGTAAPNALFNNGTMYLCGGTSLTATTTAVDAPFMLVNGPLGSIAVRPATDTQCAGASGTGVTDNGFAFDNQGLLVVSPNQTLSLAGQSPYQFDNNSQVSGGGTVTTTDPTTKITFDRSVLVANNATFALDGGATLVAGLAANAPNNNTNISSGTGGGNFKWLNGTITGAFKTSGQLGVTVSGTTGTRALADGSVWTLYSPTTFSASSVSVGGGASVTVGARVTLTGAAAGFTHTTTPTTGHVIGIGSTGSIVTGSGASGIIDFPVVSSGMMHVSTGTSLDAGFGVTQNGSTSVTYIDAGGNLKAESTGRGSAMGTFVMNGGKIFGAGTLSASLTQAGGTLETASTHGGTGTFAVRGGYTLQSGGTLYFVAKSTSKHSWLRTTGVVKLGGKATANATGFRPKVGTSVKNLITAKSVTGKFSKVTNMGNAAHTTWKPVLTKTAVSLVLAKS